MFYHLTVPVPPHRIRRNEVCICVCVCIVVAYLKEICRHISGTRQIQSR